MPPLTELAQLGKQALLAFVAQLLTEFATLKARVAELLVENAALKARLEQREPDAKRSAAPFSKGQRKPHPKRPGRKPGQGPFTFRTLPRPDQCTAPPIDVRLPEPSCPCCGELLHEQRVDFAATTEIPPQPKPIVQPYRVWVYRCPTCETTVRASHPDLAPDQYGATAHRMGPRVMAAAHATHYGLGVPVRKVPALLQLYTGVRLTQSAITQDALRRASGPIGQHYQSLRDQVPMSEVTDTDDTGWRVGGEKAQLMIFVTDTATVFQVRPRRLVDADNQRLLDQFGRHHAQGNLLRFLEDPRVKPTNNDSERGFRFAVIQRKVSQCSKTASGARAFEAFASVIKTAMRQGKDVVERLTELFRGIDPQSNPT